VCEKLDDMCYLGEKLQLFKYINDIKSRDSSVGVALGLRAGRFPAGAGNFSLHHRVQNGSGAHPASCPMGIGGLFAWGVKLTTHLHLVPRSENEWSCTSTSPVPLHDVVRS
jgi:hypothetical protein